MNPTRKRRLWLVLAVVAAAAIATTLIAMALQRNVAYLYTPNEVLSGQAGENVSSGQARFRLGGMVAAGSFKRAQGSMEAHFDVDIAVEGDGIAFGASLARALGGRAVPHEKFGTAVVKWPGGRVDVATARTEFYDEPGALPAVEQASIQFRDRVLVIW